jgi:hypothetical protein
MSITPLRVKRLAILPPAILARLAISIAYLGLRSSDRYQDLIERIDVLELIG